MSGIFDQIINYSPPLIVSGTVNYKGTWDASTNNPTLNSSPAASTKGDYYVVSTAGTQFGITFAVGDWIISNGTAWEKVDLTDAVSSVFGRTGAVVGVSTDYSAVGLTNTAIGASNPSTGAFTTVTASSTIAATGAVTGSNLSGTNTGDQTTISGNAGSATVLQTARAIYGNNFDGSAALTQAIAGTYGGTGVNNGANTITIAGNVTHAGAFTQSFTATANTSLTLPVTGTLATLAGSEALSNKTITASAFNGTVGATTPSTIAATTINATGTITSNPASGDNVNFQNGAGVSLGKVFNDAGFFNFQGSANVSGTRIEHPTQVQHRINGATVTTTTSTGLAVTGALSTTGAITISGTPFGQGAGVRYISGAATSTDLYSNAATGGVHYWAIGESIKATLTGTGLGIGTTSPSDTLQLARSGTGTYNSARFTNPNSTADFYVGVGGSAVSNESLQNNAYLFNNGASAVIIGTNGTERARIDTSGNLLVNSTTNDQWYTSTNAGFTLNSSNFLAIARSGGSVFIANRLTSDGDIVEFKRSGSSVGTISVTTLLTSYNTTSDYRRKSNVQNLTGSGTFIDALKPRTFDWDTGDKGVGFIAHEFAEVSPTSVTGEKDAVDEKGDPKYQSMQASSAEVIANLVAELQSLRQRVAALESN